MQHGNRKMIPARGMAMCNSVAVLIGMMSFSTDTVFAQQRPAVLEVLQLQPNFYMIAGAGTNIAVQAGPNGVMLVNAGTVEAAADVLATVAKLGNPTQPIRYIVNTSADPEVVGGNARLAAAGRAITAGASQPARTTSDHAATVSHEAVLTRLSDPSRNSKAPPIASENWPSEAFYGKRRVMFFNNEGIEIIHQPAAHSDGDTLVFFRKSDVIVAGNIIDADRFPRIDIASGGSIQGEIEALNRIIEMAIPPSPYFNQPVITDALPGGTAVLPGRGRVLRQIDVVQYRDMLVIISDTVQDLINENNTLAQIKAADPAKAYKTRYGSTTGSWTTDMFIEAVYNSLISGK